MYIRTDWLPMATSCIISTVIFTNYAQIVCVMSKGERKGREEE